MVQGGVPRIIWGNQDSPLTSSRASCEGARSEQQGTPEVRAQTALHNTAHICCLHIITQI